jgi:predicted nucleic acid-binding protein
LTAYLDTSVLAGFFVEADAFASRARAFFSNAGEVPVVSDFDVAEFASVVARLARMGRITQTEARETFALFDSWRALSGEDASTTSSDIQSAATIIRRLDLNLRAPDAINLAIALRLGASLVTFDRRMAENSSAFGIAVEAV